MQGDAAKAVQYREWAEQLREIAGGGLDEKGRTILLQVSADYMRMANSLTWIAESDLVRAARAKERPRRSESSG